MFSGCEEIRDGSTLAILQGLSVHLALQPVGFRRGIAALNVDARERPGMEPAPGNVLVFRSRQPGRVKVLHRDGGGTIPVTRWSDEGSFRWPPFSEGVPRLSRTERSVRFDVCDWSSVAPSRRPSPGG